MAINERVGILTHVPGESRVTPGLIGGIYVDYLTKELDFLDDSRVVPSIESMISSYHAGGDNDTLYREWRDQRFMKEINYWNARKFRIPFTYQNFVIDPSADGSNAFEWIRTVTPSPNGDFNVPYPNPVGSTQSSFYNSERPLKHLYLRVDLPVEDMAFSCSYASGCNYYLGSGEGSMEKINTDFRANRDAYAKAMNELALGTPLSEQGGMVFGVYKDSLTEEDLAAMRQSYLDFDAGETNPNPWSDERFRFAWGDGQNPVEGAPNATIHNMVGIGEGANDLTNHPLGTMPFEVLPGVTSLNRLPAVSSISLLGATGSAGDIVMVDGDDFAWDPQNEEWSRGFYRRFLSPFTIRLQQMVDAKLKAVNENILATRPFLFAGIYTPIGNIISNTGVSPTWNGGNPLGMNEDFPWITLEMIEEWILIMKCVNDPNFPNCDYDSY